MSSASTRTHSFTATVDLSTSASRTISTMRRSIFSPRLKSCRCQFPTIRMTVQWLVHPFCHCLLTQQVKQGVMLARHTLSHMLHDPIFGLRPTDTLPEFCSREDLATLTQRRPHQAMQVRVKVAHSQDPTVYSPTLPRMLSPQNIEDRGWAISS